MKANALLAVLVSGMLFGAGLALSTMIQPEVVLSFLRFSDFGLLLVLGGAVVVTFFAYRFTPVGGAALFGIGWGLCGVCPGPAIAGLGAGNWPLLWALAAMFLGAWAQGKYFGAVTR